MKTKIAILLGVAACAPFLSHAAIISGYGTLAETSTASNCSSSCSTANGGDFIGDSAGGEFIDTASSSEKTYASAQAFSSLSGSTYLPILRVETVAGEGRGGFATAFGVQGYTYTGTGPSTFTLDYNLHGSVGANPTGSINNNELRADIGIIFGGNAEWFPHFPTLMYEVAYTPSNLDDTLFIASGNNVNTSGSFSFELNTGDEFYVVGSMGARSVNGFADGWNTLSLNFQDDTGLVAVSAVPVPAAVWLFASGLIGLAGVARRRKA